MQLSSTLLPLLLTLTTALEITSPAPSAFLNPSDPITITWSSSSFSGDPKTIDLILIGPSPDNATPITTVLGSSVPSADTSYTVPAWTILDYGTQFTLQVTAAGNRGDVLSSVGSLSVGGAVGVALTDASGSVTGIATAASVISGSVITGASAAGNSTATAVQSLPTQTDGESSLTGSLTSSATAHSSRSSSASASRTSETSSSGAAASSTATAASGAMQIVANGWLGLLVAAVLA